MCGHNYKRYYEMKLITLWLTAGVLSACTTQAWYEGSRQNAFNDCQKIIDSVERNRCMQNIPSYQDYQQKRQELSTELGTNGSK
mgnify:CR=1 FL=1|jgi:hypothetical protein